MPLEDVRIPELDEQIYQVEQRIQFLTKELEIAHVEYKDLIWARARARKKYIYDLHQQGMSLRDIANEVGLSYGRVHRINASVQHWLLHPGRTNTQRISETNTSITETESAKE